MATPQQDITGDTHYDSSAVPAEELHFVHLAHQVNLHRARLGRHPLSHQEVRNQVKDRNAAGALLDILPMASGLLL